MTLYLIVFIVHLFTTLFMTGLCWFVQVVHYPLFREIRLADFSSYERKNFVTGFIAIPMMSLELLSGLYLIYCNPVPLHFANVGFMGMIGLSTLVFQVPLHLKLSQNPSRKLIDRLIRSNWIRTVGWTLRAGIVVLLLYQMVCKVA